MDVVTLSRIQFAVTIGFHFIFVPLTIGLSVLMAILETMYVRTGNEKYKTMVKFWGKLFTINFVLGVVTGVTMEFQFGTNWSKYSEFMGDIFGSPLAFEALMAFFLESTFLSLWIWGWDKVSKKVHAFACWMVALGTHLSAVWIIVANGFMQNPVGYVLQNGRAELTDFWAVFTNTYAWHTYLHTILSMYCLAGFFALGVSAYHLLRKQHVDLFQVSIKLALGLALFGTVGVAISGGMNGRLVAKVQPTKFAAMEAIWDTQTSVPMNLIQIPDEKNGKNAVEALPIPGLVSFLATFNGGSEIKGLNDFAPADRPPVNLTFYAFRAMVGLGVLMLAIVCVAIYLHVKGKLAASPRMLKILLWTIPVPYVVINLGWMVAEVGRQPWTVFGLMRTADSVSPVPATDVWISLGAIVAIYTVLVGLDIFLLMKNAKAGPVAASEKPSRKKIAAGVGQTPAAGGETLVR